MLIRVGGDNRFTDDLCIMQWRLLNHFVQVKVNVCVGYNGIFIYICALTMQDH